MGKNKNAFQINVLLVSLIHFMQKTIFNLSSNFDVDKAEFYYFSPFIKLLAIPSKSFLLLLDMKAKFTISGSD